MHRRHGRCLCAIIGGVREITREAVLVTGRNFVNYSQVPIKRGVLIIKGLGKIMNFTKRGVRINGGSKFEKELKIIIKHWKKQKQFVIFAGCHSSSRFSGDFLRSSMP